MAFERAIELEPANGEALVALAKLAQDDATAIELFDRAARAMPNDPDPQYEAAVLLLGKGSSSREEAERRLLEILSGHPAHGRSAMSLARIYLENGDAGEKTLRYAIRGARFDADSIALETLGLVRLRRGEGDQAVQAFRWAVDLGTVGTDGHYGIERALTSIGDVPKVREALADSLSAGRIATDKPSRATELDSG
jgi:tetratricopeptide (TPR) repeat protein